MQFWLTQSKFELHLLVGVAALFMLASCSKSPQTLCQAYTEPFKHTRCSVPNHSGASFKIETVWKNPQTGAGYQNFDQLIKSDELAGSEVVLILNAGMYDQEFKPLAYYVEQGQQLKSLNLKEGGGNFHLMPNGVFWIDQNNKAHVTESGAFDQLKPSPRFATQSGPMLVIGGELHPKFNKQSTSKKIRSGVGVCGEHVEFVISDTWVNFYEFGVLFKDKLHCKNALFLDGGTAPALYSSELGRHDPKTLGPMITVTKTKNES